MAYICPVCAYPTLPEPPDNFSICPSCGTEFGYDDAKVSHIELQRKWIKSGAPWFSRARQQPAEWNPWLQLFSAGYTYTFPLAVELHISQPAAALREILVPLVPLRVASVLPAIQFSVQYQ